MKKENLSLEQIFLKLTTTETESEAELATLETETDKVQIANQATGEEANLGTTSDLKQSTKSESASADSHTGEGSK